LIVDADPWRVTHRLLHKKSPAEAGLYYLDGLVSTGKSKFPYTILKIILPNKEKIGINFIHIFFWPVDNSALRSKFNNGKNGAREMI